jgi:ABC-type sugar transport system ATPase subunit
VLLLDEPLSNLDANLREEMRFEIRRLHDEFQITTVYVTHDQAEAMTTSRTASPWSSVLDVGHESLLSIDPRGVALVS